MKTIILAGGFGTRMSEFTNVIPKPMVPIGGKPILWHIMNIYSRYQKTDFIVALGYLALIIKEYFLHYGTLNSDFTVNLQSGAVSIHTDTRLNWDVTLVDTGANSMTGGRVKRLKDFIGNEPFLLTYGDGVANVDIDKLIAFHKSHGKMVTVTAVRPSARFGELQIEDGLVTEFMEKPQATQGWINGGYFVMNPEFLDFIDGDETILEKDPLENVARAGQLMAYRHDGFWQCMDTKRDVEALDALAKAGDKAPWYV